MLKQYFDRVNSFLPASFSRMSTLAKLFFALSIISSLGIFFVFLYMSGNNENAGVVGVKLSHVNAVNISPSGESASDPRTDEVFEQPEDVVEDTISLETISEILGQWCPKVCSDSDPHSVRDLLGDDVNETIVERIIQNNKNVLENPLYAKYSQRFHQYHGDILDAVSHEELIKYIHDASPTGEFSKPSIPPGKKLRIITPHFNRVDLLDLQYKTIKTYVQDEDYEFIVVNNAIPGEVLKNAADNYFKNVYENVIFYNYNIRDDIEDYCKENNITHEVYEWPASSFDLVHHIPAVRCGMVLEYILENFVFNYDGYVLVLDSDFIFYDPVHIGDFMTLNDVIIGGIPYFRVRVPKENDDEVQERRIVRYFTNQLLLFDPSRMPGKESFNIRDGYHERITSYGDSKWIRNWIDVGGYTAYWLDMYEPLYKKNIMFLYTHFGLSSEYLQLLLKDVSFRNFVMRDIAKYKRYYSGSLEQLTPNIVTELNLIHFRAGGNYNFREESGEQNFIRAQEWMKYFSKRMQLYDQYKNVGLNHTDTG